MEKKEIQDKQIEERLEEFDLVNEGTRTPQRV